MQRRLLRTAILLLAFSGACLLPLAGRPASASAKTKAPIVVSVRHFGAVGNGSHDDASAIQRAVDRAAARPGSTVLVPRGVYLCAKPIRLADHVNLRGRSRSASWLQGRLEFGSFSSISKLKIGRSGACALTNRRGARRTSIVRCRLHGGGSRQGADSSVVYLGGPQGNVSDILFARCAIERTSYVPPSGVDAYARNVGNTITIHEFSHRRGSGHVEDITFRDCHLGASNGHATGALRMMMEAYTWDDKTGRVYHGWRRLTFDGCTIEAADTTGLDFADGPLTAAGKHSAHGVLITGCTFRGARRNERFNHGGLPIVYEGPTGIVIRHNTFYASPQEAIGGSGVRRSSDAPALLIVGNTFDMTRSPIGQKHQRGQACISLVGHHSRVLRNRFRYDAGLGVLIKGGSGRNVFAAAGNLVRGNTFIDTRNTGGEPTVKLADDSGLGCRDNHISGNTIRNRAAGRAGVIAQTSGNGTNYAENNTLICGSALPFLVRSGRLVRKGNMIH